MVLLLLKLLLLIILLPLPLTLLHILHFIAFVLKNLLGETPTNVVKEVTSVPSLILAELGGRCRNAMLGVCVVLWGPCCVRPSLHREGVVRASLYREGVVRASLYMGLSVLPCIGGRTPEPDVLETVGLSHMARRLCWRPRRYTYHAE